MTASPPRHRLCRAVAVAALLGSTVLLALRSPEGGRSFLSGRLAASQRAAAERQVDLLMALHRRLPQGGWADRALAVTERARSGGTLGGAGGPVPVRPLDVPGLHRLTEDGTAWLFTWVGERRTYVWWLDGDGSGAYAVNAGSRPAAVARRLHANLAAGAPAVLKPQLEVDAASLARVLLGPLAPRLHRQRLAVVAEGALASIPWSLLPSPRRPGRRLVDDHETVLLPSASLLAALRRRAGRRGGVVPGGASR